MNSKTESAVIARTLRVKVASLLVEKKLCVKHPTLRFILNGEGDQIKRRGGGGGFKAFEKLLTSPNIGISSILRSRLQ